MFASFILKSAHPDRLFPNSAVRLPPVGAIYEKVLTHEENHKYFNQNISRLLFG